MNQPVLVSTDDRGVPVVAADEMEAELETVFNAIFRVARPPSH